MSARDDYPWTAQRCRGDYEIHTLFAEVDRLRADAKIGEQMAHAVIELVDEKAALEAERDRLRAEVDTLRFNLHESKSTLTAILAKQEAEP